MSHPDEPVAHGHNTCKNSGESTADEEIRKEEPAKKKKKTNAQGERLVGGDESKGCRWGKSAGERLARNAGREAKEGRR